MRTKHKNISELKNKAIALRSNGVSYPEIERTLGISRSTLSGWLSKLVLSTSARNKIYLNKLGALDNARKKAVLVNTTKRLNKISEIETEVKHELNQLIFNNTVLEVFLGALYLGEGFKRQDIVGLGNSNPEIIKAFIILLRSVYKIDEKKVRCILYLRADQDSSKEIKFWSNLLSVKVDRFGKTQFDKRTLGKKTYLGYHGVCAVYYYDADIAKRIFVLQNQIIKRIVGV